MKKDKGFTLVELLIVMGIVAVLAGIAMPSISNLMRKTRLENQVRRIYSDLMNARLMAMTQNRSHFVVFAGNQYTVYADTNENGVHDGPDTQVLVRLDSVPFTFTNSISPNETTSDDVGGQVNFNGRGIASTAAGPNGTIKIVVPGIANTYVDCISISPILMRMGKLNGGTCAPN